MVCADSTCQQLKKAKFDWKRTLTLSCWVGCVVVPLRYRVIRFWDHVIGKRSSFWKGLATNQTLTCCLLPTFMTVSSVAYALLNKESPDMEKIRSKIKSDFLPSWAAMTMFWCPFHTLNFYFVPPVWRVISASCAQFLSGCFLSMMQFGHLQPLLSNIRGSATKIRSLQNCFLSEESPQSQFLVIVDVENIYR